MPITNEKLRSEFDEVLDFYHDAGSVFQNRITRSYIKKEEAEAALSWCNRLAEIIYCEEMIYRGAKISNEFSSFRPMLWSRINGLKNRKSNES